MAIYQADRKARLTFSLTQRKNSLSFEKPIIASETSYADARLWDTPCPGRAR